MRKSILLFICLILYIASNAQNIEGVILDAENQPLPNSMIHFEEKGIAVYSDFEGNFSIETNGHKTVNLVVQYIGYKVKKIKILQSDFGKKLTVQLEDINLDLKQVDIVAKRKAMHGYTRLRSIEGTSIYSAKKAEIIDMASINANLAANSSRQIFSKISGLNIWESDCSGLQLGIGSRGLSPSRTANFNVRQNGYDVSADAIGYPDAYFAPPMQALESIEVVKGAASLQYGTQFGGLINFKLKEAPKDKKIEWNSSLTYGSNDYLNSFNRIAGTLGKFSYTSFYQYRKGDCWRCNSEFDYHSAFFSTKYQVTPKLSFSSEYTYLGYLAHQPGGLTDILFSQNPQQSIRDRNWFKIFWNLWSVRMDYKISSKTTLESFVLGQYAGRDASGFLGLISRTDPLDETDLLQDTYKNLVVESKILHRYNIKDKILVFLGGLRYMQGKTIKKQGETSNDQKATFKYLNPERLEGSDYVFPSKNISIFTENVFNISDKFSLIMGARWEYINQNVDGYYTYRVFDFAGNILLDTSFAETKQFVRDFIFFGGGVSYKHSEDLEIYTNFSQNYRAVGYNNLRIVNPNLVIDPNLSDEKGFNFDLGIKGNTRNQLVFFDANVFVLKYNNKIGTYFTKIPDPVLVQRVVRYRTNISQAISYGVESFIQADIYKLLWDKKSESPVSFSAYANLSLISAIYSDSKQTAFFNKKIEDVPPFTARFGFDFQRKKLRMGLQYSYTRKHFSDATNAALVPDATVGIIPSYYTIDFNAGYKWKSIGLQLAISNITNNKYFTRRADGYPGPGILPSDAINANITLNINL